MQPASPVWPPDASPLCPYCPVPTKVGVQSRQHERYRCPTCRKTFTQSNGTPLYGLKTDLDVVTLVLTLLVFGCPLPAIVMAFRIDERMLADWLKQVNTPSVFRSILSVRDISNWVRCKPMNSGAAPSAVCCGWLRR
jgi:transposase-like protein